MKQAGLQPDRSFRQLFRLCGLDQVTIAWLIVTRKIRQRSHVDVYLMGHPDRKFNGGFGVSPADGAVASGLPKIERGCAGFIYRRDFLCAFVSIILTPPFSMGETLLL